MNRVTRYMKLSSSHRKSHAKSLIGVVQCRSTSDLEYNLPTIQIYILSEYHSCSVARTHARPRLRSPY